MRKVILGLALLSTVVTACGGGSGGDHGDHAAEGHEHASEGTVPGGPAEAADSDREIEVVATDELRFDPTTIDVEAGEIITFVVQNKGSSEHEFVLGDADYQHVLAEEGHDHGAMSEMENAVTVDPGETEELTWEFTDAGEVLYGCHVSGHYDGGMVGTIEVS